MTKRRLHDGREDGLRPLRSLSLSDAGGCADLVRGMRHTSFGGRQLGEALDILLTMARDPDCRIVVTVSGAMTVAKQGLILCEMIDRGLADVVVTTGALVAHGLTESIGLVHYATEPGMDDSELFAKGYNRIYDTLEMEANLDEVEGLVNSVLDECQPEEGAWSSAGLCEALGAKLEQMDQGPGILRSASRRNVPVFIPAFTDSELGLDVAIWSMKKNNERQKPTGSRSGVPSFEEVPPFNPFLDLQQYARWAGQAERLGIFTIGGGVPRNWAQQVAPYHDIAAQRLDYEHPAPRFRYGIRICPEPVHWGGLSGCTYTEGVSWGKFVPPEQGGRFAEVYADATLAWPLLMKAAFEILDREA